MDTTSSAGASGVGEGLRSTVQGGTSDAAAVARLLAGVPLFSRLDAAQHRLLAAHARPLEMTAGQTVVAEGDLAREMFLIGSGSLQVWCRAFDGSDLVLARLSAGDWFGEQGLLPGGSGRRNASVRVLQPGRLWALDRSALQDLFDLAPDLAASMQGLAARQLRVRGSRLGERSFAELGLPADAAELRIGEYAEGEVVFHQGDAADRVYLVLDGRALAIESQGVDETPLSELLPGQFFGELAVLNDAPRSATVRALQPLRLASVDGSWLRNGLARAGEQPRLQLQSLSAMYLLPRRGLRTLQQGQIDGQPCWTAVNHMPDGRRILSTRLADAALFSAQVLGADGGEALQHVDEVLGLHRSLRVLDGRLVALNVEGEWPRLGQALALLIDGEPLPAWQVELFRSIGDLWPPAATPLYDDEELVCACTRTSCGQLRAAMAEGLCTLEALAERTGAMRVCGGCTPLVKELLGDVDWTPALPALAETVADDTKRFRLLPLGTPPRPFVPGQYVVVQARVGERWLQRAYTLSSVPGEAHYEITVKREGGGTFSRWLFERMRPRDLLRVSSPRGDFVAPQDGAAPLVFLVGGIGVTPALAFARALAKRPGDARLHLDYSVSRESQAVALGELRALQRADARFSLTMRITSRQGRFAAADAAELRQRFADAWFFLCGSSAYMDGVRGLLLAHGVDGARIRSEEFTPAGVPAPEVAAPATAPGPASCPVHAPGAAAEEPTVEVAVSRLDEARQMLQQFYAEIDAPKAFAARWQQVQQEWAQGGSYAQTTEELSWAVRQAWRNSIRCVGRLYWGGLAVRDMRHVHTGAGMLDAIMDHIGLATNGGSLRPTITVFPPQAPDGRTPRVWSPQLFRYAAYRLPSGQVLGDPANLGFTQAAIALGWAPPKQRSAFDLLPVVVQAAGEAPCWREIPRELVLEVPISHPQLPWFEALKLKWYALPAVSNMRLDAGGLDYKAIPFNGWYQGTEIGARNFGDTYRYNLLPEVARRMGLDTSSERTLWRDRAMLELNVAVLHSYEKAGVTLMDHHASCSAFDKFEAGERAAGRPVHALWSWLVPPISGSAVALYHRGDDWRTQELKPNYYGQTDPWLTPAT